MKNRAEWLRGGFARFFVWVVGEDKLKKLCFRLLMRRLFITFAEKEIWRNLKYIGSRKT